MKLHKYAAIDIGSNGVRLLISNVIVFKKKETQFKKSSLVRVPIRLGEDVFTSGKISGINKNRMCDAMQAFQLLMKVYGVEKYKACATSAMREATNNNDIVKAVFKYISKGGDNAFIPISILAGLNKNHMALIKQFFSVAFFGVYELLRENICNIPHACRILVDALKIIKPLAKNELSLLSFFIGHHGK